MDIEDLLSMLSPQGAILKILVSYKDGLRIAPTSINGLQADYNEMSTDTWDQYISSVADIVFMAGMAITTNDPKLASSVILVMNEIIERVESGDLKVRMCDGENPDALAKESIITKLTGDLRSWLDISQGFSTQLFVPPPPDESKKKHDEENDESDGNLPDVFADFLRDI